MRVRNNYSFFGEIISIVGINMQPQADSHLNHYFSFDNMKLPLTLHITVAVYLLDQFKCWEVGLILGPGDLKPNP